MIRHRDRLHNIGVGAYERSFCLHYIDEDQMAAAPPQPSRWRILLDAKRQGLRADIAGRTVALVGNAPITGCGRDIDSHDIVIRISSMRHWQRSAADDGERLTLWTGNPWFVIQSDQQGISALPAFEQHILRGGDIWGVSPFHISIDCHRWFVSNGVLDRFIVAPPPFLLYDAFCRCMDADGLDLLYSQRRPVANLVGLPNFEILLTGTRILLLLELCGVAGVSLFGFNLFASGSDPVWFGHDLEIDRQVILGAKKRFESAGRSFYWHDAVVASDAGAL